MAVQTIVLYGSRLFDVETYATNQDPESLSAVLSDTATLSDSEAQQSTKALNESLAPSDVRVIAAGIKALGDTATLGEVLAFVQNSIRFMSDSLIAADAKVSVQQVKGLSDFITVKDWIELKLQRAGIWQSTPAFGFAPSQIHLYGPGVYYGVDYYGANPSVNWLLQQLNAAVWQMTEVAAQSETLYAQTLFSQSLFGSISAGGWTKPVSTVRQAWTNDNGESHN